MDRGEPSHAVYIFHSLVGHHGIFSLTPFWLLSVVGWFGFRRVKSGSDRDLMWAHRGGDDSLFSVLLVPTVVRSELWWRQFRIAMGILDDSTLAVPCPSWRRSDASLSMDEGMDTCCVSDQLFLRFIRGPTLGSIHGFFNGGLTFSGSITRRRLSPKKFAIISLRIDVPMYSRRFSGFVNVRSFFQCSCKCLFHDCRIDWSAVAETDIKVERQFWERFLQSFITVVGSIVAYLAELLYSDSILMALCCVTAFEAMERAKARGIMETAVERSVKRIFII